MYIILLSVCGLAFISQFISSDWFYSTRDVDKFAMDAWIKEYGVLNGIWLTDTIGDELCRRDMTLTYATLFSGVRNDSGDPFK